jgi:hypothetical protein
MLRSLLVLLALAASGQIIIRNTLDTGSVAVVITAPTSSATYDAGTASTITTLAGTSASDRQVTGCTWTNSLGGSGSATGTTSWSIASVALTVGSNVITITCTNNTAGTGQDVITVTRSGASSANTWVDNSCTHNGDGTAVACASGAGAVGAFNDLQSALDSLTAAGDYLEIRNNGGGDYVTATGSRGAGAQYDSGFGLSNSGSSGNLITVANYPGETPVIRNCASGSTTHAQCNRLTFSMWNESYIRITGLRIYGAVGIHSDASTTAAMPDGNVIDNNEISRGMASPDDGNWSGIWTERQDDFWAHHNNIHDIENTSLSGSGAQSSAACIKVYSNLDAIFEYNTCNGVAVTESQSGCYDDKEGTRGSIWRYNLCINAGAAFRTGNQDGTVDGTGYNVTGLLIEHNVAAVGTYALTIRDCLRLEAAEIDDLIFRQNTCVSFRNGMQELAPDVDADSIQFYSNIIASVFENIVQSFGVDSDISRMDYNCVDSDVGWSLDSNYSTIALLRAGTAFEDNGVETASSFGFTSGADTDYHLSGGSCVGMASTDGTTASAIDAGAYSEGVTCVGHTCS